MHFKKSELPQTLQFTEFLTLPLPYKKKKKKLIVSVESNQKKKKKLQNSSAIDCTTQYSKQFNKNITNHPNNPRTSNQFDAWKKSKSREEEEKGLHEITSARLHCFLRWLEIQEWEADFRWSSSHRLRDSEEEKITSSVESRSRRRWRVLEQRKRAHRNKKKNLGEIRCNYQVPDSREKDEELKIRIRSPFSTEVSKSEVLQETFWTLPAHLLPSSVRVRGIYLAFHLIFM